MHGFKKGAKPKPQHFANGGMVKGAGTGTSDDIKTKVAAGSYIMPADSTQKIGEPSLGALGFNPQAKVPVNLSNGEYEMPPEQVHAVGVQALDQMKEQTHTPVNQPQVQQGKSSGENNLKELNDILFSQLRRLNDANPLNIPAS